MKLKYALALPLAALFVLPATLSASAAPITPATVLTTLPSNDLVGQTAECGGSFYTVNRAHETITGVTPGGAVSTITLPAGSRPISIACSSTGQYLYFDDMSDGWISRIELSTGYVAQKFAYLGDDVLGSTLEVDDGGFIYTNVTNVENPEVNVHVAKISPIGAVDETFADLGNGEFGMASVSGTVGAHLYFSDQVSNTIQQVDLSSGAVNRFASVPEDPERLAVDSHGNVFALTYFESIIKFAPDGTRLDADFATATSERDDSIDMTIDDRDNLYLVDFDLQSVALVSPAKVKVIVFNTTGVTPEHVGVHNNVLYTEAEGPGVSRAVYKTDMSSFAPHITSAAPFRVYTATHFTTTVTATGPGVAYSIANGSLPGGFTLDASTGVLSSPTVTATPGTYKFDIVATNPWGSDTQHVTFQVIRNVY
jgi:hypothetical protein